MLDSFNVESYIDSNLEEVVINSCFGGFSLSKKAVELLSKLTGIEPDEYRNIPRDDKYLVAVVKALGKEANGNCADLQIVDLEKGTKWYIREYDGIESIEFKQQMWLCTTNDKRVVVIATAITPSQARSIASNAVKSDVLDVRALGDHYII